MKRLSSATFQLSVAPQSGADATVYWLVPSVTQVKRKADGTHLPEYVSCESKSKTGESSPVSGVGTIRYAIIYLTGETTAETVYQSRIAITPHMAGISFRLYVGGQKLDEKTVLITDDGEKGKDGLPGPAGIRGRLPFPAGKWDANTTYTATDDITPIVYYEDGKTYYVMRKNGSVTGLNPVEDYGNPAGDPTWMPFENLKAVFTEILMTRFAKLASALFWDDYMFSQHGKDADGNDTKDYGMFDPSKLDQNDCPFTPNLLIDFLKGKLDGIDMHIRGNSIFEGILKGVIGTFRRLQGIDDKGKIGCEIGFSPEQGKMYFEGDMQHQGTYRDPITGEKRKYRFLTSDIWCRGEFGHSQMTTMTFNHEGQVDFYAYVRNNPYDNNTGFYKNALPGQQIDCIVLEGSGYSVLRICNALMFKMVTVVNRSDSTKRVIISNKYSTTVDIPAWQFKIFITSGFDKNLVNDLYIVN